jgi:hypothetical protein
LIDSWFASDPPIISYIDALKLFSNIEASFTDLDHMNIAHANYTYTPAINEDQLMRKGNISALPAAIAKNQGSIMPVK